MKHKLIFFAMAVFLCLGLISCNQAMAGLPEWLPEEVMDQPVQQFEAVYTAEGSLVRITASRRGTAARLSIPTTRVNRWNKWLWKSRAEIPCWL